MARRAGRLADTGMVFLLSFVKPLDCEEFPESSRFVILGEREEPENRRVVLPWNGNSRFGLGIRSPSDRPHSDRHNRRKPQEIIR